MINECVITEIDFYPFIIVLIELPVNDYSYFFKTYNIASLILFNRFLS